MGKMLFAVGVILLNLLLFQYILNRFEKYIPLETALMKIQVREWRDGYKCQQFSEDLIKELNNLGIQSNLIIGEDEETIKDENVIHAWVGVWIEPQTGEFTNNYEYYGDETYLYQR